jgi:hypothetical protein
MHLCIVTSVFKLRRTRPLDYYLTPTIDMLIDLQNSNIDIFVFTDQPKQCFPEANNIHILNVCPSSLIQNIWEDYDWKSNYVTALQNRSKILMERNEQKSVPDLLAIWLGKIPMMKIASEAGDVVLWQDSGIRMSKLFSKNFALYKKCELSAEIYQMFVSKMIGLAPLVFMSGRQANVLHGVDMSRYGSVGKTQVKAGFILAKSSEIELLQSKVKEKWSLLIENNDYGTEENALTLYQWERTDSLILPYDCWLDQLEMK